MRIENEEIRQANLTVEVKEPVTGHNFAEQRPVFVHSASDLFWGGKFANAQLGGPLGHASRSSQCCSLSRARSGLFPADAAWLQ